MVKFTIISTLREGEDTILASGGEGVFAGVFSSSTEKLSTYFPTLLQTVIMPIGAPIFYESPIAVEVLRSVSQHHPPANRCIGR